MRDLNPLKPQVIRTPDLVGAASEFILQQARAAFAERGEFRIALSGGRTPRPVYEQLARAGHDLPWERVLVTFSDERCVPPEDEQSNYRMARESLLIPAAVPDRSVIRLRGEIDPHLAAQEYEDQLSVLATQKGEVIYRHDVLLLGLGDDGHTASLFPGTAALEESSRPVVANFVPKVDAWRLTFTFPLIEQARTICFLVDEKKDRDLIDEVLRGDPRYPASRVQGAGAEVIWIIAEPA